MRLSPQATGGTLVNVATLTGVESPPNAAARLSGLVNFSLTDDAVVLTASALAMTGATIWSAVQLIALLIAAGVRLILVGRRRRSGVA